MPYQKQERKIIYFRPDQITVLARHPAPEPNDEQLNLLVTNIIEASGGRLEPGRLTRPRAISFEAPASNPNDPAPLPRTPFSLIFIDVRLMDDDPVYLFRLIQDLDKSLQDKNLAGLLVETVSPNWLTSGAPGYSGGGGPGSWPVPYCGPSNRAPYEFPKLLELLGDKKMLGDGSGVDVAILDTAPCLHDLVEAYDEWHDRHPLIHTLLAPGGPLQVYPATLEELHRMGDIILDGHEYKMTDHGLFVAGIIHTLAPRAKIHLIEVLNPYGVGDIETIAGGFQQVMEIRQNNLQQGQSRALVVNCSLVLNLPIVLEQGGAAHTLQLNRELLDAILARAQDQSWQQRQVQNVENLCKSLYALGSKVIAAAGNDRRGESAPRPPARYPAAFDSVEGVGALEKDRDAPPEQAEAASYSNLADRPSPIGVATLGGEGGEGHGLLGLYLGEFPCCQPNCTKWAWWAGTSFATPILTGTIAAALSGPTPLGTVQIAINHLNSANVIEDNMTAANEKGLIVRQM